MGRLYSLELTPPGAASPSKIWTSYTGKTFNPSAQNIEYDVLVAPFDTPTGMSTITVYGVALQDLMQPQNFVNSVLELKAGMGAGLPLVNPAQAGTIMKGTVYQCFGNWEGLDQSLDLVVNPGIYTTQKPGNFSFNWVSGVLLSEALRQTLSVAYPNTKITINISADLLLNYTVPHVCGTLEEFAQFIGEMTDGNFGNRVSIGIMNGSVVVYDSAYNPAPVQLVFTDFIGQPTWLAVNTIQIKLVARSDLQIGSIVRMPQGFQNLPGFVTTTANSFPSTSKYQTAFQNNFIVSEVRQIGNFRSNDAAQWSTIINCLLSPNV